MESRLHPRLTAVFGVPILIWSLAVPALLADERVELTLETIFHPDAAKRIDFSGELPSITWLDDRHFLLLPPEDEAVLERVEARSGKSQPFFDADKMEAALGGVPGMTEEDAKRLTRGALRLDGKRTAALLAHANDLFYYRLGGERVVRLTHDPEPEVGAEFSPDGRYVSFVRRANLHLVEVESGRERALTHGGSSELLYGRLDWVYQEEIYGRGNFKGYWWSPDSRYLAFLRLDETPVREFTVVDHLPVELETEVTNYPKAGSPNPKVSLAVVPVVGGDPKWVDTSRYEPIEHLIVRVDWSPDSSRVLFQVQDREQRWLDLVAAERDSGKVEVLFRESSPAWVNVLGNPHWLKDGSFLWSSERSGYQHLYHYSAAGELKRQLTEGKWEARTLYGVNEEEGWVYFAGTKASPIGVQLYRIRLEGADPERLSGSDGTHAGSFSPDFGLYVDRWSDVRTPPQLRLHDSGGKEIRVIEENRVEALGRLELGEVELLEVKTRDGFPMQAMLIKPPDFDPAKRYPVLQYNYGGPHAPVVRDAWGRSRYLWHHLLAKHGYVIWMCDNRSASGQGIQPTWEIYERLGEVELQDIEDGVGWLKEQPWVDSDRIGIWGWSYGGFMASYALTHSELFKAGIAGAPVTDWRLYDTVYTERYMRMPQNNPEGYARTSVVKSAADLSGKLLLLHGTMDDNVHLQNTIQLVYELEKAGKEFELMLYPRSRHGVRDREQVYHMYRLMTDFVRENL